MTENQITNFVRIENGEIKYGKHNFDVPTTIDFVEWLKRRNCHYGFILSRHLYIDNGQHDKLAFRAQWNDFSQEETFMALQSIYRNGVMQ